jgi:2-pyrone-4,6-dicarboxylate lactonase
MSGLTARASLPAEAWDCHTHIFGDPVRFPPRVASSYAMPDAPYEAHAGMLKANGLDRGVIVQPAPYAQDMSVMIEALAAADGRLRGVASGLADMTDQVMGELNAAGVRALRFVDARTPSGERFAGSSGTGELELMASRLAKLGWHAEVWSSLDDFLQVWPKLEHCGVPVVLDHMGGFDLQKGVSDPSFARLIGMVREGAVWVKLTLCRRAPFGSPLSVLRPFHDALVEANPGRLLWGSDWPFVRMGEHAPTVPALLDLFTSWVDDENLRRQILVENPTVRYGQHT